MRYLSTEMVKAYCRNELPTDDDEWFDTGGDAAEAFIDHALQRRVEVATTASARVYRPNSYDRLRIHDCTTVTLVSNNGTTVTSDAYQLEPLNGMTWAGETRPYEEIVLLSGGYWYTDGPKATVSVTATWGWAAVPPRIVQAALIVAKEIITNRDEVKLGLVGFSDVGGVVARTNPIVRDVVADYKRVEAWGIA